MTKLRQLTSILITGASSGIGAALAMGYARTGVNLYLSGRNSDRLASVAKECRETGAYVDTRIIDVCDRFEMGTWIVVCNQENPLDLVIANAGISGNSRGAIKANSSDLIDEDITRDIFATNMAGVLNTVLPSVALMTQRGRGQIAIVSSLAGLRGLPSAPAYSASKACVRAWGEGLRGQLAPAGIAVSVICPGFVESAITDANKFPMPFIMSAPKAASKIIKGLSRNRPRIAFPWPMYSAMWLMSILPLWLVDPLLAKLPKKS